MALPHNNVLGFDFKTICADGSKIDNLIHEGYKKYWNGEKLNISKLTGKMEEIKGISTNPLLCGFCEKMQNAKGAICQKCYSVRLIITARQNAIPAWTKNSLILSNDEMEDKEIPIFKSGDNVRFNPHGEVQNITFLINLFKIALKNPDTNFALFTKREDLVSSYLKSGRKIPGNVIMVKSTIHINKPKVFIPEGFNYVFNVITPDYAESEGIIPNCPKKCKDCLKCYKNRGKGIIYEILK